MTSAANGQKTNDGARRGGSPSRRVVMVRHGHVAERYQEICYGSSDVELAEVGWQQTRQLAAELAGWPIDHLYHSGLSRSRAVADAVAQATGLAPMVDGRLREIHFGEWELKPWSEIYAAAPDALDRLLQAPDHYAPPGGETLFALRDRVLGWFQSLPETGLIVAVAHAGPIAALRGTLAGSPIADWPAFIPTQGTFCDIEGGPNGTAE